VVYGSIILVALGVAALRGKSPFELTGTEAWIPLSAISAHVLSFGLGIPLAVTTVWVTREFVRRFGWAKMLHADLRPTVTDAGNATLVILGVASAFAEELFFRGLLAAAFGVVISSLAFGALHQLRGRTGWIWAAMATVVGVLLASLFLATGSLVGPIVAHATINVANLRFLRDTDVRPEHEKKKTRRLGGLLDT
jgi:uncharacterized protein